MNKGGTNKEDSAGRFWTWPKFILAVVLIVAGFVAGLYLPGDTALGGSVADVAISFPLAWFFILAVVSWVVLATFINGHMQAALKDKRFDRMVAAVSWLVPLLFAWFMFIFMLDTYIFIHFNKLI